MNISDNAAKGNFIIDYDDMSKLEDVCFKYERLCALTECLHMLVSEGTVEVRGTAENTFDYSLYEIMNEMWKNNDELKSIVDRSQRDRRAAS